MAMLSMAIESVLLKYLLTTFWVGNAVSSVIAQFQPNRFLFSFNISKLCEVVTFASARPDSTFFQIPLSFAPENLPGVHSL